MSAPLAGKFQDHYAILEVEAKSDSETIQKAYAKLAKKYHPNNAETGSAEMFEAVNSAYETLSDPELRGIFDKLKGVGQQEGAPRFSGVEFFDALGREALRRAAILCVLYDRRLSKPNAPSLSMRHLEVIVEATAAELAFSAVVLEAAGLGGERRQEQPANHGGWHGFSGEQPAGAGGRDGVHQRSGDPGHTGARRKEETVLATLNRALARTPA